MPKGYPALAEPGWVVKTSRFAGPGPTRMGLEVTLTRPEEVNSMVISPVTLCERLV